MRGAREVAVGLGMLLTASGGGIAQAATTERVSVDSVGGQADAFAGPPGATLGSFDPSISDDGEIVAFASNATDLVAGDSNGTVDVFVRNRATGVTQRASLTGAGTQANGDSAIAQISGDGRFVAFESTATNLVPGDTNGEEDVFVRDLLTGTTERVSLDAADGQLPGGAIEAAISDDGRLVAFRALGVQPNQVLVRDRVAGTTELASVAPPGTTFVDSFSPAISGDGRFVAFLSFVDATEAPLFLRDRTAATAAAIPGTAPGPPALNGDGRFMAFSLGIDVAIVTVMVRDRVTGATDPVGSGFDPAISSDGRFVSFTEPAEGPGPQGILLHDRTTATTERASVNGAGESANNGSFAPDVSAAGRVVAFESAATNLVPGDTNGVEDVFVRDRAPSVGDQLAALRARIRGFGLPEGIERSLLAEVAARCGSLRALIQHARAQAGKQLTPAQAFQVITEAGRIAAALRCA